MLDKIRAFLYRQAEGRSFKSDHELFLYLFLYIAISFAAIVHVFLYAFYLAAGLPALFWYNAASIFIYLACFRLLSRQRYAVVGAVISAETTCFVLLSVYLVGINDYIILYWFIIMVMQVLIPYTRVRIRAFVAAFIWLCMMGVLVYSDRLTPVYSLPESMHSLIRFFHINAAVIGIILDLLVSDFIWKTIQVINERKMEELLSQAHTDPLTGLYNRRYSTLFFEDLKRSVTKEWCVALVDIDNFKLINDNYGHSVGDKALIQISSFIRKCLRRTDVIFRWGGEEFLLFLEGVDLDTAVSILEKLRAGIEAQELAAEDETLHYTVTIGVVPLDVDNIPLGIDQCDKNMYLGKTSGKNRVVC